MLCLIHFEEVVRDSKDTGREHTSARFAQISITHHYGSKGIGFEGSEQRNGPRTQQIVETIAVLESFHLVLKDEVMRRAEIASEGAAFLCQAAIPEIDFF